MSFIIWPVRKSGAGVYSFVKRHLSVPDDPFQCVTVHIFIKCYLLVCYTMFQCIEVCIFYLLQWYSFNVLQYVHITISGIYQCARVFAVCKSVGKVRFVSCHIILYVKVQYLQC